MDKTQNNNNIYKNSNSLFSMEWNELTKEVVIIFLASLILGISTSKFFAFSSTKNYPELYLLVLFFFVLIMFNILVKKFIAYSLDADIQTKFWSWYQTGFARKSHFRRPVPMLWVPLLLAFISRGMLYWLAILEFEIKPRVERVARRQGLYRFSEMTDWDIAVITAAGVFVNLILSVLGYIGASWVPPLALFGKLNLYYAFWSLVPLSGLDGTKIFFGSRKLWFMLFVTTAAVLIYSLMIL